ncbi:hypothetical protein [Thalassospira sp. UBA1131]|uniref:hypothetical protein n=1 Tax=Thalassospira sp. UBA1131 TaxID=1947672 RepID=UPI0025F61016|nr:hypothetical protein [Thalassospira sp. UBA1131]
MHIRKNKPQLSMSLSARHSLILLWAPVFFALLYLSFSLLMFKYGPIDWPIKNEEVFWVLNFSYLVMFFLGFCLAIWNRPWWVDRERVLHPRDFSVFFWPACVCVFLVVLIGHRNLTMSSSYVPTTIFSDFLTGLISPEKGYVYKLSEEAKENFSGNPPVTFLYGALSFSKLILIYILVAGWPKLSRRKKTIGSFISIFPIITGVCVGTNKPIFDVALGFSSIILICALIQPGFERLHFLKERFVIILMTLSIIIFAGFYYQHTMSVRAGGLEYAASLSSNSNSKVSEIRVKPGFQEYCESSGDWTLKICSLLSTGTIYMTQGYYGMSLSTDVPLETTYGMGHSKFLLEALRKYLDIDLNPRTFQHKIDDQWSATGQWHSAYSQWANDVGFAGVVLVMLALGFYFGGVWVSALIGRNDIAICSIPLIMTLILFIPANNQIFNILGSFASFVVLFTAWTGCLVINKFGRCANRRGYTC